MSDLHGETGQPTPTPPRPIRVLAVGMTVIETVAVLGLWVFTQVLVVTWAQPEAFAEAVEPAIGGDAFSLATIFGALVAVAAVVLLIRIHRLGPPYHYLGDRSWSWSALGSWAGAVGALLIAYELLNWLVGRDSIPEFMVQAYESASRPALLWIAAVLAAPLAEEVLFRGFLFRGLAASPAGTTGAIVLTSFAWTSLHLQYGMFELVMIFFVGLALGTARAATGSVMVPLLLHAANNLISTVQVALTLD